VVLYDEDILTMGLQWSFIRPDSSPKGNSTSWKLRWSPDGKMIAVVYFDNTTIILDGTTGELVTAFGTSAGAILGKDGSGTRCWGYTTTPSLLSLLRAVAWSPDGEYLAISGDHRLVEVFNTTTWVREKVFKGHTGSILSLAWSPDGAMIASGEGTDQILPHHQANNKNVINIWDVNNGEALHTLTGHKDSILSVSWSANSSWLASASDGRNLKLWDAKSGELLHTLGEGIGHSAGVLDVDWSPNQTQLVSGSRDFKIRLWDVESGMPLGKPWKDHNCVRSTHWHPTGKYIATAGVDQTIKIRNASSGKEIVVFTEAEETNSEVMSARWSPDGSKLAACSTRDATVRLYAMGFAVEETDEPDWLAGIAIFLIICIIGLILIFLPLRNEFHERRK
jgi:WD40 repeat protein